LADGLEISGQVEPETGLLRTIIVCFNENREGISLKHILENHAETTIQISAWSLTMLPPGGRIIMPLRIPLNTANNILPDRSLVFWPYSQLEAGIFTLTGKTAVLEPSTDHKPFKFGGLANWLAYERNGLVFVKIFSVQEKPPYPDRGCSAEVYANGDFVELESLSPLIQLEPGQSIEHIENWQLMSKETFSAFLSDQ
jgi:hypothetical protein